jgi:cytochrome P450
MSAQPVSRSAKKAPFYRVLPEFARDPIAAFEQVGRRSGGEIVRINLGLFRPYLVTRPEHVQHVLRDNSANYVRDGMFWKPLRRLLGNGILGYGSRWHASRKMIGPLFTAKHIDSLMAGLTSAILDAVDGFQPAGPPSQPVDAVIEMNRVGHRAFSRVLFSDRIAQADFDRLAPAIDNAANSVVARLLLPFAPLRMPMPGDRAFRRSVRTIEDVMMPLIRQAREQSFVEGDVVSTLCYTPTQDGRTLTDAEVRDDVVAMFAAGTETTAVTMAWFWVAMTANPDVAERLCAEVDEVVGQGPVQPSHLPQLRYTKMVLQELLRLYSAGWIVPRQAANDDLIDGVRIPAQATVLVSPYLTHRMPWVWEDAHTFDPERFAPEREAKPHRYAYFPFGGGAHQCIGQHFFTAGAQILIAAMLSRYRPVVVNESVVTPKPAASLRPRQRVDMLLRPRPTS